MLLVFLELATDVVFVRMTGGYISAGDLSSKRWSRVWQTGRHTSLSQVEVGVSVVLVVLN